jgi:hypothetical protein
VASGTAASALPKRKVQDLPEASVGVPTRQTHQGSTLFGWTLPGAPGKPALLWSVLIAGVLILAAVAWSLLRQLKADALKS